jgi:hypothetical protein
VKDIIGNEFPFELVSQKVDLPELQGEPLAISQQKCKIAAEHVCHDWYDGGISS